MRFHVKAIAYRKLHSKNKLNIQLLLVLVDWTKEVKSSIMKEILLLIGIASRYLLINDIFMI